MKDEIYYGRVKYLSFILLDIVCFIVSNYLAFSIYITRYKTNYTLNSYSSVVGIMVVVDLFITAMFNTLERVLRRKKRKELYEGVKHIGYSYITLAVVLFLFKQSSDYSRVTITLAYLIYFVLFVGGHIVWKYILINFRKKPARQTAVLMTMDGFLEEGIERLKEQNIDVRYIYLLKNSGIDVVERIPVIKTWERTASAICWDLIDRVYIYGLDHQMVPQYLINACKDMGLKFHLVDFTYRVLNIKTVDHEDPRYGSLSFLEGKRDIPFPIRRAYWITETEAEFHRGYHAHKLNCQLLFCPYGAIDLLLDDGTTKNIVTLDKPEKGLLLMPGIWREMVWKKSGSVLCVLASEYYDPQEYIRNYDEFLEYSRKYKASADILNSD